MAQPSFESLKIEADKHVSKWEKGLLGSTLSPSDRRLLVLEFAEAILSTRIAMLNEVPSIVASALDKSPK